MQKVKCKIRLPVFLILLSTVVLHGAANPQAGFVFSPDNAYCAMLPHAHVEIEGTEPFQSPFPHVTIFDIRANGIISTHYGNSTLSFAWHPTAPILFIALKATALSTMVKIHGFDLIRRSREAPAEVIHTTDNLVSAVFSPDLAKITLGFRDSDTGNYYEEQHALELLS